MGLDRTVARGARLAAGFAVGGLLLGGLVTPAAADQQNGLTITLTTRWHLSASAGAWNPYVVTVRNDGGATFEGTVLLIPNQTRNGPFPPDSFPQYRGRISVPGRTERALQVFVIEPGAGYHADLYDRGGKLVASADPELAPRSNTAMAVLSDAASADQQIGVPLRSLSRIDSGVSRFTSAQAFPTSALELSGLNGVIIDQFDTGSLSQAQVQALRDFVGLGGTLIEAGGGSWRRTLLPLPPELLPMRPTTTTTTSLAPLAELGGLPADLPVQIATGDVDTGARVAVSGPGGPPLVVEGRYGAGSIVELAFDPLAPPVDGQTTLGALLWSQAIARGLAGAQGASQLYKGGFGPAGPSGPGSPPTGSGPGTWVAFPGFLFQALGDLSTGASPPFGLLIVLLIVYVVLVSGASYALLRVLGRRGLLWAVVPGLAVVVASAAYLVGFGTRGSDFQETQLQFQRLGPDGLVEAYSFDGVLSPRHGDVRVTTASNALVSTAILVFGPGPSAGHDSTITPGLRPEVRFTNVPVWDVRPVQTLTIGHPDGGAAGPGMPIDVQLRLEGTRLRGQVVNHTSRTVREVRLVSSTGLQAPLTAALAPGASVAVDVQPSQAVPLGKGVAVVGPFAGPGGMQPPQTGRQALLALAASEATGRPGELALVGFTDPIDTLRVEGARPLRTGPAMVVEPVRLRSATSVGQAPPRSRLVSSFPFTSASLVDVYELELPQGLTGHVGLSPVLTGGVQRDPAGAEIYDFDRGTWRSASPGAGGGPAGTVPLTAGETGHGVVRVRVRETAPGLDQLSLVDLP